MYLYKYTRGRVALFDYLTAYDFYCLFLAGIYALYDLYIITIHVKSDIKQFVTNTYVHEYRI